MDPKSGVHFWVRCAHRADKWTRLSAQNDALLKRRSIGWIPRVESTFAGDAVDQSRSLGSSPSRGPGRSRVAPARSDAERTRG
jgi:hypothetical protein